MTAVDRPDNGQDERRPWRVIGRYQDTGETVVMDGLRVIGSFYRPEDAARTVAAVNASGRAGAGEQQRELVVKLLDSHADLGTVLEGVQCLCGWAGRPYSEHVADELLALLGGPQPDEQPEPCPVYSHGTDGWHCAVTGDHDQHTNAAGDETW